jgi:HD-GYP domain-containing protein (c-di-GMP phosphodiesterase class II)
MQQVSEAILNLIDTSKNAISALHLDRIMHHITTILPSIIDHDAAIVRLMNQRNPRLLSLEASTGIPGAVINEIKFVRMGLGFEGICAKSRAHVYLKDLKSEGNAKYTKTLSHLKLRSALCVPIVFDNDIYGTITIASKSRDKYSDRDIFLMRSFSNIVGIALRNAYLYQNLKESYLNTINSLVLIMESRDPYMRGHSERVTYVAVEIARSMNLSESDIQILRTAGKLHDIGKITISDAILSKTERLTPSDWAEIHLHPIRGVEIVMPLRFLESGFSLIRHHHERYDGRGYPDGLKKESIPLLARIITIADAFDAMTSKRPYREPLTFEHAMEEIVKCSGTQFDPALVNVFVEIIDKIK